ncbi:DNA-binding protein HU [Synechococcus sp. JA-2-3B'a(2-13)]|jgi:DNA-binding protein HU-beta|uniref:HU family DNA-binding protein n=1 Tax=unclassified Synechococcus TaxID=2626047 RepID=UPI0000694CC6|nr:HU family DNA-binding protein [Synechococcus sp. JA-2-3B'a(2-13)]ABD01875.1 DNA-binding protein HU [Synechococcus sp. JA-2-3B'a(2-13)]
MNKAELVDAVAHRANVTKKEAEAVISAALEIIVEEVASRDENGEPKGKVILVGFGSFEARKRKEREGRNPKTNQKMVIPERIVPTFAAGKSFREAVAGGKS